MIKTVFKYVPKFKTGIGQVNNGKVVEVSAGRITLNKKNVMDDYKKLNNHHSLITENEIGDTRLHMFTSQAESKNMLQNNGSKHKNVLITQDDNIAKVKNMSQYLSPVGIDPEKDTVKITASTEAEIYCKTNANILVKALNNNYGNLVLRLENIHE